MSKNFYYYSKKELKFVQIENFYVKFGITVLSLAILITLSIFFTVNFSNKANTGNSTELIERNTELKTELTRLLNKYNSLEQKVKEIDNKNNELRLAVNLPVKETDDKIGVGGSLFENVDPLNTNEEKKLLLSLDNLVDKIEAKVSNEINNYSEVKQKLTVNEKLYESIPAIKPVEAKYGDGFGMRFHPILKIRRMHAGVDFLANTGTPVYAPGAGKVIFVGRIGGYGLTIKIKHGFGYTTLYGHLSKVKVKRRQFVKRGDLIALSGNSGRLSTGPHLHYEVRYKGVALNPRYFIYDDVDLFDYLAAQKKVNKENPLTSID